MKQILIDAYINGNLGDDLFLKILFERYPNTKFVIKANNKYKKLFNNNSNVIVITNPLWMKMINAFIYFIFKMILKRSEYDIKYLKLKHNYNVYDALVKIGGSIFIDSNGKHFEDNLRLFNKFIQQNKPVFILGCNFETNYDDSLYYNYHKLFSNIDNNLLDVCFRDMFSYELFKDCKCARFAPDIVFGYNKKTLIHVEERKYIGISLINLRNRNALITYKKKYENKLLEIINKCIDNNQKVALFSFCSREGDYDIINTIIDKIDSQRAKEYIEIYNYNYNLDVIINIIAKCKCIIATRFHAMILGWVYNTNVIPIIYSEKMLNVIKDIKFSEQYIHVKDIEKFKFDWIFNDTKVTELEMLSRKAENHFTKLDLFLQ